MSVESFLLFQYHLQVTNSDTASLQQPGQCHVSGRPATERISASPRVHKFSDVRGDELCERRASIARYANVFGRVQFL
jgi:hypothetical protein